MFEPSNESFEIRNMDRDGVGEAVTWADREGWEPGLDDAAAFFEADREGFFSITDEGRTLAMISAVRCSPEVAFVGLYIVDPEFRGQGFGKHLWDEVVAKRDGMTLGLDAVPEQVGTYASDGFEVAYGNARYSADHLPAPEPSASLIRPAADFPFESLAGFDGQHCFGPRPAFLNEWIDGHNRNSLVSTNDSGEITGFAASRKSAAGTRIGPVFADDQVIARNLILTLASNSTGRIAVDVPQPNLAAVELVEGLGMARSFETSRMYRGPAPVLPLDRIFGITTLELG
ncbi:MAG: GNAT family N-acetyltransferase [Solirubrobacterales bacterium]